MSFRDDLSWGGSFGTQMLAEISLLEAKAKQEEVEEKGNNNEEPKAVTSPSKSSLSISNAGDSPLKPSSQNKSLQFYNDSTHQDEQNSTNIPESASVSLCGLPSSDPSELKPEKSDTTARAKVKALNNLSVHSPLSCSTPVNLRRTSLRSGSALLKLQLSNWGLPAPVVQKYAEKKITALFPWQVECLQTGKVLNKGNLIYSAPTSSGKTLVAELLMLKTIFDQKKKGIYILPFVAVAKEKTRVLKGVTEDVGVRVESFAGSSAPPGGLKNCDLAICTIEKANSLINRLIEEGTLNQLGIIVVDELHLIGDSHRGYLLELLLTKVLYASSRAGQLCPIQVVGMSATLPDLEVLAKWLRADLYRTDFRPIPLREHIKIGADIFTPDFRPVRTIDPALCIQNDIEHVVYLSLETVIESCSALIFCPTKNWCEKMAQHISGEFFNLGSNPNSSYGTHLRQQLKGELLAQVLERLKASPAGLDPVLGQTVRFGVAFHHAGLTSEERDVIETAFRHGVLRILVATSTLSSGVNLPARRVIIRTPIFHGTVIDPLVYRQMIGRAGRYGEDTDGESYLICQPSEKHRVQQMFASIAQPLKSCLLVDNSVGDPSLSVSSSMKRAMLEIIATGSASTAEDLKLYMSCTLLAVLHNVPDTALDACIAWLQENKFIQRQTTSEEGGGGERLAPTQLGLACLASSVSPDESLVLLNELRTARRGLILDSDLHLVYQITPTYVADQLTQVDWLHYLTLWEELSESQKRVGEAVGVEERFLVRAMKGTVSTTAPRQYRQLAIHRRFYMALALHDLMNEVRLARVADTYKLNKGTLQSLQQQTATFAGMVTIFCQRLGWNTLYVLLEHFQSRLLFGVQLELCDLMRLPSMDSQSARLLYDTGLTSVASVATASPENIEVLLKNARPFEGTGEKKLDEGVADGRTLVAEARKLLQLELGVRIQWADQKVDCPPPPEPAPVSSTPGVEPSSRQTSLVRFSTPVLAGNAHLLSPVENISGRVASSQRRISTPVPAILSLPKSKNSTKENRKPPADITPDMFLESSMEPSLPSAHHSPLSKAVESLRLSDQEGDSFDTMKTPHFAACAEKLAPVTEQRPPPVSSAKCLKRRVSFDTSSFIMEATPPNPVRQSGRSQRKKSKLSTPPAPLSPDSIVSSSSCGSSDDSSIIPSSAPSTAQLVVNEVTSQSKLKMLVREQARQSDSRLAVHVYKEKNVVLGLAAAWSPDKVNYIRLRDHFDTALDQGLLGIIQPWLEGLVRSGKAELIIYDVRSTTKDLRSLLPSRLVNQLPLRDVDLCHWILEPAGAPATLQKLSKVCSQHSSPFRAYRGREKVLQECRSLLEIYQHLHRRLTEEKLWRAFVEVEMPTASIMLKMEETGMAFDRPCCESILQLLRQHVKCLEETAHRLAGRPFSLTSTKEVSRVVKELNLCVEENRAPTSFINPLKKKVQPLPLITTKASLIKLGRLHPLPKIIVEYRKVSSIIQTIICPLLQASTFHLDGFERISGVCEFRHVTGRINIVQPNLQHIPRPFTLSDGRSVIVRKAFRAVPGTTLLSADYSQLELRILAHLSGDSGLCGILSREDGDVFRRIALTWKGKASEADVTDEERQQAKQICYGLVYGMGCKTLAEQLEVPEEEAQAFMESFHATYPGIQLFITKTIDECRLQGYVLTLHGRKRFLPAINSTSNAQRTAAERQAVNTKIQGSAADLVKTALVLLDRSLREKVADAHLVHQIHDELLFQVPTDCLQKAARIVQRCMETATAMKIRLPVAIKTGTTWGSMEPLKF